MDKKGVLVVGELNVDILLNNIQGFPVIGEEILAETMALILGSSSAIFAANLSSLGISTSFCGMVGKDMFGQFVMSELQSAGINTDLVVQSDTCRTGLTMILNYEQDRANVTHCGAMEYFTLDQIPLERLNEYGHLHFSSYFLQKGLQQDIVMLFKTAHELGLSTSLDPQWDPANRWDFPYRACLPFVDFFLPNEKELLALTGETVLQTALEVLEGYAHTVVVKKGVAGAVAASKGEILYAAPYLHDRFVDAIGAGDSFNAGFISSIVRGISLQESLSYGNLCGSISTTAAGGTAAFSNRPQLAKNARTLFNIEI